MILNERLDNVPEAGRINTDMSDALVSQTSKSTGGASKRTEGQSTIHPYETLAAGAPGVQRYGADDEGDRLTRLEASTMTGYTLMPPSGEGSTFIQSLFNAINMLLGIGVLAYPNALKRTGWIGVPILCLITLATRHTAGLLKKSIELHPDCRSFSDLGRRSYGALGTVLITIAFFFELLVGACTAYLILFADHLSSMYPLTVSDFLLIGTAAIIPTTWLKDLSAIAYLSYIGVFATIVLVVVVLYSGLDKANKHTFWTPAGGTQAVNADILSILYGTGVFAVGFSGHPVFTSVYTSMKEKRRFPEMLNYTYVVTIVFYAGMSVVGYVLYGNRTLPEVTMNLPPGIATTLCKWTIAINSYCKFTLTLQPIAEVFEDVLDSSTLCWLPREDLKDDSSEESSHRLSRITDEIGDEDTLNQNDANMELIPFKTKKDDERLAQQYPSDSPTNGKPSGSEKLEGGYFCLNLSLEGARYVRRVAIRTFLVLLIMTIGELVVRSKYMGTRKGS
eukprot:gb/GECG01013648.1/.p1 GENE.gb/GECG01013648.1/~~gb/GECG01013648.1/.p1  ORF type:complete len:506 (+),score=36.47 gb/GECG01013648.1/:1-1518(+)